jgi:hypothetical protein
MMSGADAVKRIEHVPAHVFMSARAVLRYTVAL